MARNTDSSNSSRPKLIRLLVILAIALGFVIYAYGWQVTDIDLDKPQEGTPASQRSERLT